MEHLVRDVILRFGNSILGIALFLLIARLASQRIQTGGLGKGKIDLIRETPGKTTFSLRTRMAYYTDCFNLFNEAYEVGINHSQVLVPHDIDVLQFTKRGIPIWVPSLGTRNDILMPHKHIRWLFSQSATVISIRHAYNRINSVGKGLGKNKYMLDNWQGMIIGSELNKVLDGVVQSMNAELEYAIQSRFGTSAEWAELDLIKTMHMVIVQITSRFQVGPTLCKCGVQPQARAPVLTAKPGRDEDYLINVTKVMDELINNAVVLGMVPSFLQRALTPIASLRLRSVISRIRKQIKPLFEERMETLKREPKDSACEEPNDYLQMLLRYAQRERPEELNLHDITNRLCMANFEAMHQTIMALTNLVLNILGSDAEYNTINELRNELLTQFGAEEVDRSSRWTKAGIAKLVKADSIARETLRLYSFQNRTLFRKVMVDGVKTDDGIELPKGSILSWLLQPLHTDPAIFPDPLKFNPWRFSEMRENGTDMHENQTSTFVSLTQVLSFGRGRHACPGRWLVDFEAKMIISRILLDYDIKFPSAYGGKRPRNRWVAEAYVLPKEAKMLVRRRTRAFAP
jgi:cytochrome P450